MAARRNEFVQLHGSPRIVQHQGARAAAQLQPAAAGQVQRLGIAERRGVSAGGRHRIEDGVPGHEVQPGCAQVLGQEEEPQPIGGLAHGADALPSGVGRHHSLRLPSGNRQRVDSTDEVSVPPIVQGCGEVDGAAVGAEAGAVVVRWCGGELFGGRQQPGSILRGIGRGAEGLQGASGRRHLRFGVKLRHLEDEQLKRLVSGVANTVHPVLEIRDQPGVLAARTHAVDAAIPALVRRPGAEENTAGIRRPREGADPQWGRRQQLGFAAGGFHHEQLRLSVRCRTQEAKGTAVR